MLDKQAYATLDDEESASHPSSTPLGKAPAPSWSSGKFGWQQLLNDAVGGTLAVMLCLTFNVAAAGVLFAEGDPLEAYMADGVVMATTATGCSMLVLLLVSPVRQPKRSLLAARAL